MKKLKSFLNVVENISMIVVLVLVAILVIVGITFKPPQDYSGNEIPKLSLEEISKLGVKLSITHWAEDNERRKLLCDTAKKFTKIDWMPIFFETKLDPPSKKLNWSKWILKKKDLKWQARTTVIELLKKQGNRFVAIGDYSTSDDGRYLYFKGELYRY